MDEVDSAAHRAIVSRNWDAVRQLLHPYLHWTCADGVTIRGRTKVLAMLEGEPPPPAPPTSVQLRDGQIYRWVA